MQINMLLKRKNKISRAFLAHKQQQKCKKVTFCHVKQIKNNISKHK